MFPTASSTWKLLEPIWNEVGTNMEGICNFVFLFQHLPSLSHCWNLLEGSSSGPHQQRAPSSSTAPAAALRLLNREEHGPADNSAPCAAGTRPLKRPLSSTISSYQAQVSSHSLSATGPPPERRAGAAG